jgi:hypothetical protein
MTGLTALIAIQIDGQTWGWARVNGQFVPVVLNGTLWILSAGFPPALGLFIDPLMRYLAMMDANTIANQMPGAVAPVPPQKAN